jgi:hypothetical protein
MIPTFFCTKVFSTVAANDHQRRRPQGWERHSFVRGVAQTSRGHSSASVQCLVQGNRSEELKERSTCGYADLGQSDKGWYSSSLNESVTRPLMWAFPLLRYATAHGKQCICEKDRMVLISLLKLCGPSTLDAYARMKNTPCTAASVRAPCSRTPHKALVCPRGAHS